MSHVPHDLPDDFPELADRVAELRQSSSRFAHLADRYQEVNHKVYRAESNLDPMDRLAETELRKTRAALKDELYALLTTA